MMRGSVVILLFVVFGVTPDAGAAQTFTAGVRGAVRESDRVVPGVTVQLINEASGAMRATVSNDLGEYDFSAVPPGMYTIRAALEGFKAYERTGLRVATQQFITVDVLLEVGGLQETITVSGQAPLLDTTNASIGTVLAAEDLNALPSVARNMYMMSVVVPTVVSSGNQVFTRLQDLNHPSLVSLGGGARRANNYVIDGVSHTDLVNRPSVNPSFEAVDSVSVQLHTYDAETGRTGGGTYNVTFKSGGNDFRGSAFYQERPSAFVANNFFTQAAGQPKPRSYFHNAGGGIGGPIVRNRTFFWFAMEGYTSLDSRSSTLRVPTSRERAGDFSQSVNSAGQLVTIYDPLTTRTDPATGLLVRDPFPGNILPADRLNPVALNILKYYPLPTRDVSNGSANLDSTADQTGFAIMSSVKIDHRFTDKVSLSGLYITNKTSRTNENFWERGQGPNRFADPRDGTLDRTLHLVALNNTWLPANNTVGGTATRACRTTIRPRSSSIRRSSASARRSWARSRSGSSRVAPSPTTKGSARSIPPRASGTHGASTARHPGWWGVTRSRRASTSVRSAWTRSRSRAGLATCASIGSIHRRIRWRTARPPRATRSPASFWGIRQGTLAIRVRSPSRARSARS